MLLTWLMILVTHGVIGVQAVETEKLGIHVMNASELKAAKQLLDVNQSNSKWQYVTLPVSISEINCGELQKSLDLARDNRLIPMIRLTTKFKDGSWQIPTKYELVTGLDCLNNANWPTDEKIVIAFNEVNHAAEWGGRLDPAEYAKLLKFVLEWSQTSTGGLKILPAALDLAAPNGSNTADAFGYLRQMHQAQPELLSALPAWNSHSYPNPGFIGKPQDTGRTSLRGYQHELAFLKDKLHINKDFDVYITETGWRASGSNPSVLISYYRYAQKNIWSDNRIKAVTPFVLNGAPGPFEQFSFLDANRRPTIQYQALQTAIIQQRSAQQLTMLFENLSINQ